MSIERLDHVALMTRDVARTAQFYCDWADMEVVHDRRDPGSTHRVMWVRPAHDPAGLILVLIESEEPRPGGRMDHFGFHVADRGEVDAIAGRARAEGVLVEGPLDAGPVVGYYCMIRDPDGNLLEFSCDQLKA
jgi:catechol 2,3-dioxygenase-like lactoylglutathione lyase family enzyme